MHGYLFSEDYTDMVDILLAGDDKKAIAFAKDGIGSGNGLLAVMQHPGHDEFAFLGNNLQKLFTENSRIADPAMHPPGHVAGAMFLLDLLLFRFKVDLEKGMGKDYQGDHTQDADRICYRIGGRKPGGTDRRRGGGRQCLLGGAEAGGIRYGSGHYSGHREQVLLGYEMDAHRYYHGQEDERCRKKIQFYSPLPE